MIDHLIAPHGGSLTDLLIDNDRASALKEASRDWESWDLTPRQVCDLELLLNGGFSPLTGFGARRDEEGVGERGGWWGQAAAGLRRGFQKGGAGNCGGYPEERVEP